MSKVRKVCNRRAQIDRARRALVRTNHAAVANVEPGDVQVMVNWKSCKQIRTLPVANALCDIAHTWTVYIAVFCQEPSGAQYSKATEFTTAGMHLVANLEALMIEKHAEVCASANQKHVIGSGWIAVPDQISLTEAQANAVFSAMGVWERARAA
ncbi:hypothetical protein M2401_000856 [Pseudomonas sp. JUb42]|jgi:hypothetical protein|uniref:hypothetical protein n=1 Tax=Pseudomonas sp. JUb42 TaxID=2940611 RepID=UPI00216719F2|nr:hypothetical protein [Pseudomonas sp. JUb42]MCS3467135.1 hypothetical protein [Pseudomonas sp. JUb42]